MIQLYEPGPFPALDPILHVGFLSNVICRVPLVPCFIDGNEHPTIPFSKRGSQKNQFQFGRADTRKNKGDGSKLFEVNTWLWDFGRGLPRKNTVLEDEMIRKAVLKRARKSSWETRKRRKH